MNLSAILKKNTTRISTQVIRTSILSNILLYTCSKSKQIQSSDAKKQKLVILRTYLQAIPPKRVFQIVNKDQQYLQEIIQNPQSIQPKKLTKYLKKNMLLIDIPVFSKLVDTIMENSELAQSQIGKSIVRLSIKAVKHRAQSVNVQDLINFVYKLAKHNIKQPQVMKEVENVVIQQNIRIHYPLIRKLLWSYTHLDMGTATLYSHICKTIKVGQHQLQPIQLAESAYLLSKVSDNASGGYGVFIIAEKHLQANLPRLSFPQLVQATSYMLSQNIGTNSFQTKLEQELYKKYPASNLLNARHLVVLLKSTSGYYFKYKEAALLYMMKTSTLREAESATLQHFQYMLWSWARSGKGDKQLWDKLQKQCYKRLVFLKPRQLAFFYYSLCSYSSVDFQLTKKIQQMFLNLQLDSINEHLLIKFLLGMYRKKDFNPDTFAYVSTRISQKITRLSNKQLLTFIRVLNQSDIDFQSKNNFSSLQQSLETLGSKLLKRSYTLRVGQIVQLAYLWTKMEIKGLVTASQILKLIVNLNQIPKSVFIKAMFCFLMQDQYKEVIEMVQILQQLCKYGPLGYFFSPYDFPLLVYCVFHLATKVQGHFIVNRELLKQLQQHFDQLNPVILNQFVRKGYQQTKNLIQQYHQKQSKKGAD